MRFVDLLLILSLPCILSVICKLKIELKPSCQAAVTEESYLISMCVDNGEKFVTRLWFDFGKLTLYKDN